jgi:hypothetical protein
MQRTEIESSGTARRIAAPLVIGACLASAPLAGDVPGSIPGSVISIDTDGARTVMPGAKVTPGGERNDGVDSRRVTVRDRLLVWGKSAAPRKTTPSPVFEVHTGFPCSIVNEERDFVGYRNRTGRSPRFASTDPQETSAFFHSVDRMARGNFVVEF